VAAPTKGTIVDLSRQDLKTAMSKKTDEELLGILSAYSNDYRPDAIAIAREEFGRRKLDARTLKDLATNIEGQQRQEESPLGWPLRIVAFFVTTACFGIPALLAHRHFVEKGAKRKAREWGRWALYGFVFYFALGVLFSLFK
jgi:hypothetical protein